MKPASASRLVLLLGLGSFALLTTGCYGAAPPRPARVAVPSLAEGTAITVHSSTKTTIESVQKQASSCPAGHAEGSQACTITRYEVAEPVTRTTTRATYGSEPITFGQFKVMTDPQYDTKLTALDDLAHACKRANIPRYVGIGLMLGSVVAIAASGNEEGSPVAIAGWGMLAGGMGSYALGYYSFGGRKCNEARALHGELDLSLESEWESVQGAEYATEMQTLADQFNAMRVTTESTMKMR